MVNRGNELSKQIQSYMPREDWVKPYMCDLIASGIALHVFGVDVYGFVSDQSQIGAFSLSNSSVFSSDLLRFAGFDPFRVKQDGYISRAIGDAMENALKEVANDPSFEVALGMPVIIASGGANWVLGQRPHYRATFDEKMPKILPILDKMLIDPNVSPGTLIPVLGVTVGLAKYFFGVADLLKQRGRR